MLKLFCLACDWACRMLRTRCRLIVVLLICDKPASFGFAGRWVVGNVWYHEDIDEYGRINVNALNEGDISFIDTAVQPHP